MSQIDLDDLPPKVALILSRLSPGDTLVLVRGGALVARLRVDDSAPPTDPVADLPLEERMAEVMDQFKSIIEDEF